MAAGPHFQRAACSSPHTGGCSGAGSSCSPACSHTGCWRVLRGRSSWLTSVRRQECQRRQRVVWRLLSRLVPRCVGRAAACHSRTGALQRLVLQCQGWLLHGTARLGRSSVWSSSAGAGVGQGRCSPTASGLLTLSAVPAMQLPALGGLFPPHPHQGGFTAWGNCLLPLWLFLHNLLIAGLLNPERWPACLALLSWRRWDRELWWRWSRPCAEEQ